MPKRPRALLERSKFRIPNLPLVAETSVARFPPGEKNPLGLKSTARTAGRLWSARIFTMARATTVTS
jgi:hypothetical protein